MKQQQSTTDFFVSAANFLILGVVLGRLYYSDYYFGLEQKTWFDAYNMSTDNLDAVGEVAAWKALGNIAVPLLIALTAAGTKQRCNRHQIAQVAADPLEGFDDNEEGVQGFNLGQTRSALLSDDDGELEEGLMGRRKSAAVQRDPRASFAFTRASLMLTVNLFLQAAPFLPLYLGADRGTVDQTEKTASMDIFLLAGALLASHGFAQLCHTECKPGKIDWLAVSAALTLSLKAGSLIMIKDIEIENMSFLINVGKLLTPGGMIAFSALMPLTIAFAKIASASHMVQEKLSFVLEHSKPAITALLVNCAFDVVFNGCADNILNLINDTNAAEIYGQVKSMSSVQTGLIAVATATGLGMYAAGKSCQKAHQGCLEDRQQDDNTPVTSPR